MNVKKVKQYSDMIFLVMGLDEYATGNKKHYTEEQLTEEVLNGNFIGLVKCNIECPTIHLYLYYHLLIIKKQMIDLQDKTKKVYATPELEYALEHTYKITH